jgi:PEP-CTERM motif
MTGASQRLLHRSRSLKFLTFRSGPNDYLFLFSIASTSGIENAAIFRKPSREDTTMKLLREVNLIVLLVATGLLLPIHAFASSPGTPVPEPLSLALLGAGFLGLSTAELMRRRKNK